MSEMVFGVAEIDALPTATHPSCTSLLDPIIFQLFLCWVYRNLRLGQETDLQEF